MALITRFLRCPQLRQLSTISTNITSNIVKPLLIPSFAANNNPWIWQKNDKIGPLTPKLEFELPTGLKYVPLIDKINENLELPANEGADQPKEAVRLIVIRRRKMKRHKLKKLRIRMKFENAKRRQRRELLKEKAFQAVLIKQCKDGEAFSAEQYVEERLKKLRELNKPPEIISFKKKHL